MPPRLRFISFNYSLLKSTQSKLTIKAPPLDNKEEAVLKGDSSYPTVGINPKTSAVKNESSYQLQKKLNLQFRADTWDGLWLSK